MAEQSQKTGAVGGAASGAAIGTTILPGWGTAIGAVIGGVAGFLGGGGEEEAEELGREQARMIRRAARENQRKETAVMRQRMGETKARTYASNLTDTGSSRVYRNQMGAELTRDIRWNRSMAEYQASMAEKGGEAAGDSIKRAGQQSALRGLTSLGTSIAGGAFSTTPEVGSVSSVPASGSQSGVSSPFGGTSANMSVVPYRDPFG